ncbi:MAG: hypothetical protein HY864_14975 [Chloroflexi bacterium]|nr:hypothetical protein [Chloroflexota bacterium]
MTIAQSLKAELFLTSLILLTACGTQPTGEPTPVSTAVLIQPASFSTPSPMAPEANETATPVGSSTEAPATPATATPEARMTVEQQKVYLEAHKIPYIVKPNGELQFDFMKMYTETASIKVGHQETLGADLAAAAAECEEGFPNPISSKAEDFTAVRWDSGVDKDQQRVVYRIVIISDDFTEKRMPIEPMCPVMAEIDGNQFAFFNMRSPLFDPKEIVKNNGVPYITYWIMVDAGSFTLDATGPKDTLEKISQGKLQFSFSTILGSEDDLRSAPEIDINIHTQLYMNDRAWHALHANFNNVDGTSSLQLKNDILLQRLVKGQGFSADMQGGVFLGEALVSQDVRERSFVENLSFPPEHNK